MKGVPGMMSLMRHKKLLALLIIVFVAMIVWFYWMSVVAAKTGWITNRVEGSLETGIQIVERDAPRILVANDGGYYIPDADADLPSHIPSWSKVYDVLLENLNQDLTVPLCKVTQVTLFNGTWDIEAFATLQFEILPGMKKTITVTKSMPIPHYKNPTGDALVN